MTDKPSILITGGAQRLGLHCARRFVEDGHHVIITCRRMRDEWAQTPLKGIDVIQADFSTIGGIEDFIAELKSRNVTLRAVIHTASLWLGEDGGHESFQTMFMIHMQAPYMINMACKDLFEADAPADIIHLTDYVAQHGSAKHVAYAATKAGLENLTQSFARQFAPDIKVNSVAPFLIMFNEGDSEEYKAKALTKSALHIEPGPEVVYQSVRYLMDNIYVTGECLKLDGGRHL